jgi:hypothetical protein
VTKLGGVDRILLLVTCCLAAWQVAVGINDAETLPMIIYTISFGVLLVACLLLSILGFDVLESRVVVIVSTIIPLSLSLGLIWEYLPSLQAGYLAFVVIGLLSVTFTRLFPLRNKLPVLLLAIVHGIAGMVIFLLPIGLALLGRVSRGFILVGVGGALIGLGGLLLSFLRSGKPILSRAILFRLLPVILLLMTVTFVLGFSLV